MTLGRFLRVVSCGVALHALVASSASAQGVCTLSSFGVDPVLARDVVSLRDESIGLCFSTTDTLLSSFTIWTDPAATTPHSIRALLVTTDARGWPTSNRLWSGVPASEPVPDGVNPTPITWSFDPPLALPAAGMYGVFICSSDADLLYVTDSAAPHYSTWLACPRECGPGCTIPKTGSFAFSVTFCADHVSPTRRHTWGELKTISR